MKHSGIKCRTLVSDLTEERGGGHLVAESPFPGERSAFHFTEESYYSCNVFHSREYIQREWGRFFDILEMRPQGHSAQCVVLLTYGEAT